MEKRIKICPKCKQTKDTLGFYKNRCSLDGLCTYCKSCENLRKYEMLRKRARERGAEPQISTLEARKNRENGVKYCPLCKETKDLKEFYTSKNSNFGFSSHCIICSNKFSRNRPKKEKQEYYMKNKESILNAHLKARFKITLEIYNALLEKQNGRCAICGKTAEENGKRLAVDHSHDSGEVRELLCGTCNAAIGFLKEDPEIARKASIYLEKWRKDVVPKNT